MQKKTCSVITCLALLAVLTGTPALAHIAGGAVAPSASTALDRDAPFVSARLGALISWLEQALEVDRTKTTRDAPMIHEDAEESDTSDSDIGIHPMLGPDGDPDG